MSSIFPPPKEGPTRPSSASAAPYPVLKGSGGLNTFEAAFAFQLDLALEGVLYRDEENAKLGRGREALMKWKSDEQICEEAWSTPTGWDDVPGSSGCYSPSTPDDPNYVKPFRGMDDPSHTLPNGQPLSSWCPGNINAGAFPHAVWYRPSPEHSPAPKRKIVDIGEDDLDRERLKKKNQQTFADKFVVSLNEITPPSTPSSCESGFTKAAVDDEMKIAQIITRALGEDGERGGARVKRRIHNLSAARRSRRLQQLPP